MQSISSLFLPPAELFTLDQGLVGFAQLLIELGDVTPAVTVAKEALRVRELTLPRGHWRLAESRAVLSYALARQGDPERGETMLAEAATLLAEKRGAESMAAKLAQRYLVDCGRNADSPAVPRQPVQKRRSPPP